MDGKLKKDILLFRLQVDFVKRFQLYQFCLVFFERIFREEGKNLEVLGFFDKLPCIVKLVSRKFFASFFTEILESLFLHTKFCVFIGTINMSEQPYSAEVEIDELILNAELRTEIEPYLDESVFRVPFQHLPLRLENEFLASMLDWEVAPIEPIYRWFEPELRIPGPDSLLDEKVSQVLDDVIAKLFEKKILLDFTDHLSDRELYTLIYRDILPSREKNLKHRNNFIHWDCSGGDSDIWLRFYASDEERETWMDYYNEPLPPKELPVCHRDLPQYPF